MEYVRIGIVARPQGIKGEVKITPLTQDINRFDDLEYVYIEDKGGYSKVKVKGTRLGDGCAFLFLEKIYTRDEAEAIRNKYICVDREHAIVPPEGEYFIFDIIGCEVKTDEGVSLGRVTEVLQPGANDVYVVQGNGEVLIPAIKSFVLDMDIPNKLITVKGSMLQEVVVNED